MVAEAARISIMMDDMRSPFPGMDPYLESRWPDIHRSLIVHISEALQPTLPTQLRARIEGKLLGNLMDYDRYIKIIDVADSDRIVTVVDILKPGTKVPGHLQSLYLRRSGVCQRNGVNFVEIDLLRGPRVGLPLKRSSLPTEHREPYIISVRRPERFETLEVYPVSLRQPVPNFRVPLRPGDHDGVVDLQAHIARAYVAGGHDDIDYTQPLDPPLSAEDEAWADQLLRAAGRR